jgi:hypothetical protein
VAWSQGKEGARSKHGHNAIGQGARKEGEGEGKQQLVWCAEPSGS